MPAREAAAFYDGLARSCAVLRDRMWKLDLALMGLGLNTPVSPLDQHMRAVREELAGRLAELYRRTREPETGAVRQADFLEMVRLTSLLHLVDMEIGQDAIVKESDAKDPRVPTALRVLRQAEARVQARADYAAAIAESIREVMRRPN